MDFWQPKMEKITQAVGLLIGNGSFTEMLEWSLISSEIS